MSEPIRIQHPSIEDDPEDQSAAVIRGVLANESLAHLRVDNYQRELLPSASRRDIRAGIQAGDRLPDIVLGMRGETFSLESNGDLLLHDPVYIIDGQQRCRTMMEMLSGETSVRMRLGAIVHVKTTVVVERSMFQKLNQFQKKVSPNILLRNLKEDHPALTALYGLTKNDKAFAMFGRVSWGQNMLRGELMSANMLLTIVLRLHAHLGAAQNTKLALLVPAADKTAAAIGLATWRENVKAFFTTIDECWGIRRIHIKSGAPYMRHGFVFVLASILSDHPDFWQGKRLVVPSELRNKLAKFHTDDPEIVRLAGASGAARNTLYIHLITWLNSGKRTKRLVSRNAVSSIDLAA